jgi:hypothetical protein
MQYKKSDKTVSPLLNHGRYVPQSSVLLAYSCWAAARSLRPLDTDVEPTLAKCCASFVVSWMDAYSWLRLPVGSQRHPCLACCNPPRSILAFPDGRLLHVEQQPPADRPDLPQLQYISVICDVR